MFVIEQFAKSYIPYLIPVITMIVYVAKLTIDNWKLTEIEMLRMSNFKKFQIGLTKYTLLGISSFLIMYLYFVFNNSTIINNQQLLSTLIALSIIFMITIYITGKIVNFLEEILSFK